MNKPTNIAVVLLLISIALQALAFAIPEDGLSLVCRAAGALLLVMALIAALRQRR